MNETVVDFVLRGGGEEEEGRLAEETEERFVDCERGKIVEEVEEGEGELEFG